MVFNTSNKIMTQSFHKPLNIKTKLNTAWFNHSAWFDFSYMSSVVQKVLANDLIVLLYEKSALRFQKVQNNLYQM